VCFTLVVLAVGLATAEVVLRCLSPLQLGFRFENDEFRRPREFEPDDCRNAHGFHDVEHRAKRSGVRRVVLLGDSYVAGWSVPLEATVGRRLETHLNDRGPTEYEVVALGQAGWGQRKQLQTLQTAASAREADWVITLFLPFNDVRNNSDELEKAARDQEQQLRQKRPGWIVLPARNAPLLVFRWSVLNQLISHRLAGWTGRAHTGGIPLDYLVYQREPDDRWQFAWANTESLLVAHRDHAQRLGARYAVVSASTPHGVVGVEAGLRLLLRTYPPMQQGAWDLDGPDRRLGQICAAHGIPMLALQPPFRSATVDEGHRLHWRYDGHWNAAGHDLAARLIADFMQTIETDDVIP
jgi:hypothetical protein